jgi:hypothetical protein
VLAYLRTTNRSSKAYRAPCALVFFGRELYIDGWPASTRQYHVVFVVFVFVVFVFVVWFARRSGNRDSLTLWA